MLQSLATATCLAALLTSVLPIAAEPLEVRADDFTSVCKEISSAISSASVVHWPGTPMLLRAFASLTLLLLGLDLAYFTDIGHWATSSTAQSACSVEPGTTDDVAAIVRSHDHLRPVACAHRVLSSQPASNSREEQDPLCCKRRPRCLNPKRLAAGGRN